ncbi:acyl-CoA carboxylase subunit beta [Nocardioides sp. Iso805N]|uniref:acyl-CoA carboxylase subunit beta n=1 Tax=Nocardioides sp. Iso805N TaxID=1283287 RepID=UPI000569C42D|nr:carboxyl transferase domain-containing protein [Nocardioides sp. Iso805N]
MTDPERRREWQPWLDRLSEEHGRARTMGGPQRLAAHRSSGRLNARERLDLLFDEQSFTEIGALVGNKDDSPADGFVCGFGLIEGRPVVAGAEDYTTKAGSVGRGGAYKRHRLAELALQERVPLVWLKEGAGARLGVRTSTPARTPNDLSAMADLKGEVPVVCAILGISAGHGALAAPMADFVVMTPQAALFTAGPPLVKAALGEDLSPHELGGWEVAIREAGTVHNLARDDADAIAQLRRYLSFLPSCRGGWLPHQDGPEAAPRSTDELLDVIPPNSRQPYDVRDVITTVVDADSFFEIQPLYGAAVCTGWARLGGRPVAVVANNPRHGAGAMDAAAAIKATELIEIADTFGQPVIFLIDNPGMLAGSRAERDGVLKWGGRLYLAVRRLRSPRISVLIRKGFGFGLATMAHMPHDRQSLTLALPSANIATMPAQSGGRTAHLDDETRARIEGAQRGGPYGLADRLGVDDVVHPRELRDRLLKGLRLSADRDQR